MKIGTELMEPRRGARADCSRREEGKPLAEGKGEKSIRAGQFFTYYAGECLRQIGENADSVRDGVEIDVRREPVGVVAIISPWNFPTATASWKIAPALCYGNAVVWKPANMPRPASAVALTEIIEKAGHPEGPLFSLVMGSGRSIGQRLVESPQSGCDFVYRVGCRSERELPDCGHPEPDQGADGDGLEERSGRHG